MPTESSMPVLPEFAESSFDVFMQNLTDASEDDGKTPLNVQVMSEEGDLAIDWDQDDPKMEFMTLLSEKAISLFLSEMIRRSYEKIDDFSAEITTKEDV